MTEEISRSPFLVTIKSMLDQFSPAERLVAECILDKSDQVLHMPLFELSKISGTSDATVLRTCRKLGLNSYHEFKVSLAQSIVTPVKMVNADIDEGDSVTAVIRKVFSGVKNTLTLTSEIMQMDSLEIAADTLFSARRIFAIGMGNSSSVAMDFQHKMLRLGLSVTFLSDIHMQQINLVNFCGKGDVIFAISHSGSSKLVVDATRLGKRQGATVITLTDISSSELKKEADIALCTMSDETRWNLHAPASKIAQYTIVDALYTAIAYKYRSETASYTKNVEASMTQFKY